jgi:hypothetical protein
VARLRPIRPRKIKLGTLYASSGQYSKISLPLHYGLKLWVDQKNAEGGTYVKAFDKKIPLKLIAYDDQSNGPIATKHGGALHRTRGAAGAPRIPLHLIGQRDLRLRPVDRVRVISEKRGEERRDQEPAAGGGEIVQVAIRCGWQHARGLRSFQWVAA